MASTAGPITVTYRCPAYRQLEGDPELSGPASYDVDFARTGDLGPDGRLADRRAPGDGPPAVEPDGATCTSRLDTAGGLDRPAQTGGRVFWQVRRDCFGCSTLYETSAVRSFVVSPAPIAAQLKVPRRVYAGYLAQFAFETKAELSGARIALELRVGRRWLPLDNGEFSSSTPLFAKLPAGRRTIRATATIAGSSWPLVTRTVTVRRGGRRSTSARDDGRYGVTGKNRERVLEFRVTRGGRTLRGFRAGVQTRCGDGTDPSVPVFRTQFLALRSIPIAPDGSVLGRLKTDGGSEGLVIGRLGGRRFEGKLFLRVGGCFGEDKVKLVRMRR